jgi:hypothetical protein
MAISQIFTGEFNYTDSPDRILRSLNGEQFAPGALSTADANVRQVTIRTVQSINFFGSTLVPSVTFPLAPNDVSFSDLADRYEEIERPGRDPLVYKSGARNPKMELRLLLTANDNRGSASMEFGLVWLRLVARVDIDVILIGMGLMSSSARYRVTELSASAVRLNPNQEITAAEVSLSLVEVPQVVQSRATVPGATAIKDVPAPAGGFLSAQGRTEAVPTYSRTSNAVTTWSALRELG